MIIKEFQGEYRFLSNFWDAPISYQGITYPTNEHAYQAAKCKTEEEKMAIALLETPKDAKAKGRKIKIREHWDAMRKEVMYDINKIKYATHPDLARKLLATEDAELIEGNYWKDTYWGVCNGVGENNLGKILMRIRKELVEKSFDVGDLVKIINFGNLAWNGDPNIPIPANWKILKQSDPAVKPYYVMVDTTPEIVGLIGLVMSKKLVQGKYQYSLEGIRGKTAWYDEDQLELVNKNPNIKLFNDAKH